MLNDKYRPKKFEEVIGQGKIAEILRNQVVNNKIAHSYLFEGNRGSGKTTMARIIAKAINCENPQNGNPCGECPSCKSISNESNLDCIEIDAASNNGVDTIREISTKMKYAPNGKFRVYIIDEVHMLSKSAFNAFLKTLEEPPAYGVFILCTTEKEALPVTVVSRCQQYKFRHIDSQIVESHLKNIAKAENFNTPDLNNITNLISVICDGAMRDAVGLLDQVITSNLTFNQVIELTGFTGNSQIIGLVESIRNKTSIDFLFNLGDINIPNIIEKMVKLFRDTICLRTVGVNSIKGTAMDIEGIKYLQDKYCDVSNDTLMEIIKILSLKYNDINNSKFKWTLFEMTLLQIEELMPCVSSTVNTQDNPNYPMQHSSVCTDNTNDSQPVQQMEENFDNPNIETPQESSPVKIQAPEINSQAIDAAKCRMVSMLYNCNGKFDALAKELEESSLIKIAGMNKILIMTVNCIQITNSLNNPKMKEAMNGFFNIEGVQYELVIE